MAEITGRQWKMIHRLAAALAQRDVDDNLVQTAAAYMKAYPQADLHDWLYRLVRLGNLFGSSNQTDRHRHELWAACVRLEPQPRSGPEWALVLAWAARLQRYYDRHLQRARTISNVSNIQLPDRPKPYQPPRFERADPLPPVAEEVSSEAEDIFAQMQRRWAERKADKSK